MSRRRVLDCDWCADAVDITNLSQTANGMPAGWTCVCADPGAPKRLAELGSWDLCPDCTLARVRLLSLTAQMLEGAFEKVIAGQLRPRLEGRGHSKLVLKGRDG